MANAQAKTVPVSRPATFIAFVPSKVGTSSSEFV